MTFHNILCPIDFSENTDKVIGLAAKLSEENGTITLFHHSVLIAPMHGTDAGLSFAADTELLDIDKKRLEEYAVELEKKYPQMKFKSHHSYVMSLVDAVNEMVENEKMDLIVMGTHGRTGLSRLLMGSVAEDVLRHATCPVFLIKI